MARYMTTIESDLAPAEAFAFMADFANSAVWDPSVASAVRVDAGPLGVGSAFDVVARFAGTAVRLRYELVVFEPSHRVVLEAHRPGFVSRDEITVRPRDGGSEVRYDARLDFSGVRRLLEPLFQLLFDRTGDRAADGMRKALGR